MRCCIGLSSSATSTSAPSAAITCGSAAGSGWKASSTPVRPLEIGADITPEDPLKFRDSKRYKDRLVQAQKATHERDALIVLAGQLQGLPIVASAFEFQFLGGSMGSVVGERFKRGVDHCHRASHAVRVLHRQRRRAHAGGVVFVDADGEDRRGAVALSRRRICLTSRS